MELHLDFETFSPVDLKTCGAYVYFDHEETRILCAAWANGDEEPKVSIADERGGIDLDEFVALALRPDAVIFAHNAAFERLAWREILHKRLGYPEIPDEKWRCTMAMGFAMSLPGTLDALTKALNVEALKDKAGHNLMMRMCKPTKDGGRITDPDKMARLAEYCKNDLRSERAVGERLRPLPPSELAVWRLDQRINDKGVRIDTESVLKVAPILSAELIRLNEEMRARTKGAVSAVTKVADLTAYLSAIDPTVTSLGKGEIGELLLRDDLDPEIRELIGLRLKGAKASTAKLKAMLAGVSSDGRARGLFQYHAASTGRWGGRRVQLQNLPRPNPDRVKPSKDYDHIFEAICSDAPALLKAEYLSACFGEPLEVVADCIRGFLQAPEGFTRVDTDFSSIEARLTPWAAGDDETLDIIRRGQDLYLFEAENIYNLPRGSMSKKDERRQIGKVAVLSLGYGGGPGAFARMGKGYGVHLDERTIKSVVTKWRLAHPAIAGMRDEEGRLMFSDGAPISPGIWQRMEAASKHALAYPGKAVQVGPPNRRFVFFKQGAHLWLRLQSGRLLCYPFAQLSRNAESGRVEITFYGKSPVPPFAWTRVTTWGGTLFQNAVQALARDVLVDALLQIDHMFPNVIDLHVHDEPGCEFPVDMAEKALHAIEHIMSGPPEWAPDLPLGAEGRVGRRYRK